MSIAILPLAFLVSIAVMFFIVAAILSSRNRGALGVLGALLGFGAVALAGVLLLFGLRMVRTVEAPRTAIVIDPPREVPAPPREVPPPAQVNVAPRAVPSTYGGPPPEAPNAPAAPKPAEPPDPTAEPPEPREPSQTLESLAPIGAIKAEAEAGVVRPPLPRPRPAWLDEPQGKQADGTYRKIATVELYRSRAECDEALPAELRKAVKEVIDQYLEMAGAAEAVALDMPYIHDRLVKSQWEEHVSDNLGPVVNLHNLLVFDNKVRAEIKDRYQQALVAERLTTTGMGAGLLLGFLATVFGYLKLDTLTRGYYARRLQCAAGAMILAEAAIGALLAQGRIGF